MSQQLAQEQVPTVIDTYEKDNKFYLKSFLIDDSTARNGMGLNPDYLPKHIHKFTGVPVILTKEFYHPHEFDHYKGTHDAKIDVPELKKLQEPYTIGRIISVDTNRSIAQGSNTNYSAILEITDPKAITAFRHGKIPRYVSPSIYVVNNKDPIHSITDYEPLHVAIVNNPAYGFHKANIRAECSGDKDHCSLMLAQAGLACRENQLEEKLTNIFQGSNSSLLTFQQNKDSIMSSDTTSTEQAPQQEVQQPVTEEQNKQETVIEQKVKEQLQAHEKQQEQKKTPIGTPSTASVVPDVPDTATPPGSEDQREGPGEEETETPCAKAQREYETKLVELENDIKSFKEFKANFEKNAAETKLQTKRSRIENMVPLNYANSEEERAKAIESLMKVEDEQLEVILNSFVIPATKNIRQGGLRQRAKVTDFVKPIENNKNVAQAGMQQRIDFEELDKILSFGYGGIVPKKNNGSEGGIA